MAGKPPSLWIMELIKYTLMNVHEYMTFIRIICMKMLTQINDKNIIYFVVAILTAKC